MTVVESLQLQKKRGQGRRNGLEKGIQLLLNQSGQLKMSFLQDFLVRVP